MSNLEVFFLSILTVSLFCCGCNRCSPTDLGDGYYLKCYEGEAFITEGKYSIIVPVKIAKYAFNAQYILGERSGSRNWEYHNMEKEGLYGYGWFLIDKKSRNARWNPTVDVLKNQVPDLLDQLSENE